MIRRNPLSRDEAVTLRRARLQQTPGAELAKPTGGNTDGGAAGGEVSGTWKRFGAMDLDTFDTFYLS